ncbi:hypothetical protein, partial [Variovorax sp. RCC_210]|uniref:hypothetical protein n=1 Tax=Variovorax sp. RCC_210 TaxID=3239217 RepID=UPI003525F8E9
KVGHRQALTAQKTPVRIDWGFLLCANEFEAAKKQSPQSTQTIKSPEGSTSGLLLFRTAEYQAAKRCSIAAFVSGNSFGR